MNSILVFQVVEFKLDLWPIDRASLACIQTMGPVKVPEFVCFTTCESNVCGSKVVPKMFEYARDLHGLLKKKLSQKGFE